MTGNQLKSEAVAWCDEAELMLREAIHNCSIEDIKQQVEQGATLFRLTLDEVIIGFYVLRIDHLVEWDEAVFVAGAGTHADLDVTTTAVLMVEHQVKGCKYLRIHTERAGLVKKIAKLGYKPQEFVMVKELNYGR